MTTLSDKERREIEDLLPWYATGTLTPAETKRIAAALESDEALRHAHQVVVEELSESVRLAQSLGAPSSRAFEKLAAVMEAEPRRAPLSARAKNGIADWFATSLSALAPRQLAFAAVAALAVIAVQGAILTGIFVRDGGQTYNTASYGPDGASGEGSFALVSFQPSASAADIAALLKSVKGSIVQGPLANGMFKVKLAPKAIPAGELDVILNEMKKSAGVVRGVLPSN